MTGATRRGPWVNRIGRFRSIIKDACLCTAVGMISVTERGQEDTYGRAVNVPQSPFKERCPTQRTPAVVGIVLGALTVHSSQPTPCSLLHTNSSINIIEKDGDTKHKRSEGKGFELLARLHVMLRPIHLPSMACTLSFALGDEIASPPALFSSSSSPIVLSQ